MLSKKEYFNKIDVMLDEAPEHFNCILISLADYQRHDIEPNDIFKYIELGYMVIYGHSKPQEILLLSMQVYRN